MKFYKCLFVKRQVQKINEADIKLIVPIIMPISKEFIGYLI
jgi:hypothetical protein